MASIVSAGGIVAGPKSSSIGSMLVEIRSDVEREALARLWTSNAEGVVGTYDVKVTLIKLPKVSRDS